MRRASVWACSRISAMIAAPCSLASSRILAASCRASASFAWYSSTSRVASACDSSARFRPPSIASVRSSRVLVILGSRTFQSVKKTMKNPIAPTMTLVQFGTSGFGDDDAAAS